MKRARQLQATLVLGSHCGHRQHHGAALAIFRSVPLTCRANMIFLTGNKN
jgi:hypothetical protein